MFWGEEVQFNKALLVKKEDYAKLHLRGVSTLWAKEPLTLVVTVKEINQKENTLATDIVLCHLDEAKHSQHTLNLFFDLAVQEVSFSVNGKGKVQLIGSLEAKEGKALTKELVAILGPQIKENKRKMLLELFSLGAHKNQEEGEDGEDFSEDDESFNDEEDEEEEENDEDIDEEEGEEDEDEEDEGEEEESMDIEPVQKKQGSVKTNQPKSILKGAQKLPGQKSKKEESDDEFRAI